MAHFVRVRLSGFWTTNSTLLSSEMEAFDAQLSKALNADEGGTWAPSALIEIGGSGIKITGPAEFTGTFTVTTEAQLEGGAFVTGGDLTVAQDIAAQGALDVDGNCTFGGTLAVTGGTSIGGTCAITGNVTIGGTCTVTNDLSTASDLSVQGNAAIQGNADVTGDLTADGATVETLAIHGTVVSGEVFTATGKGSVTSDFAVGGALAVTGAASAASVTVSGNATISGTTKAKGRFKKRLQTIASDASVTVNIANYDAVYLPNGVLTTDRVITVETSGAESGDVMRITSEDTTNFFEVQASSVNTPIKKASGSVTWIELIYTGSEWVTSAFGKN